MDLSIVILSFNTKELIRECLNSAAAALEELREMGRKGEVWVVDNASSDGSVKLLREEFPWVNLIESEKNVGFARGNNLAIPKTSGRYVLFFGSDGLLLRGTLPEMLRLMARDSKIGAASCQVVLRTGELDEDCHRGFPTPWAAFTYFSGLEKLFPKSRVFGQYHQTWKDLGTTHEIDACLGHFILVRRKAAAAVEKAPGKWWDEDFFFYGEDIDFCYRLKEAGFKIVYHPKVRVFHYKGASSGIRKETRAITKATRETRERILRSSAAAMRLFYKKHYLKKYPRLLTGFVLLAVWFLERRRLHLLKRAAL